VVDERLKYRLTIIIILAGAGTSLAVSPFWNYDPINLIKLINLATFSFIALALVISGKSDNKSRASKAISILSGAFVFWMILTIFFSGAPINQQIWGSFGRNTGLIAYVSLISLMYSTSQISSLNNYKKILTSFLITSFIVEVYCIIQISGLDPVNWSLKQTFATFGNVNFLSAFLGMSATALFALSLEKNIKVQLRLFYFVASFSQIAIALSTDSIQGPMIFVAGVGIILFLRLRYSKFFKLFAIPYLVISLIGFTTTIFALLNKGPLAKFVFQSSVIYRWDYMHAGWSMTTSHPFFGVGLDSYGDWYRQLRGIISTTRTGPDRVANTAHNIFLDISSNGGFPLLFFYILILILAFASALRNLIKTSEFNSTFVAIFSVWCAYQFQSLISINQIAVGVWGWIFTGILIGYSNRSDLNSMSKKLKNTKRKSEVNAISAKSVAMSSLFGLFGLLISIVPFKTDAQYKSALVRGDLNGMMQTIYQTGATSQQISQVIGVAINNNYPQQAQEATRVLINRFPKEFYGWKALYYLSSSSNEDRAKARAKMIELDPFNQDIPKS